MLVIEEGKYKEISFLLRFETVHYVIFFLLVYFYNFNKIYRHKVSMKKKKVPSPPETLGGSCDVTCL